ncbi:hypothetical protein [Dysgonomonas macrotermitis]|uniref:Chaperone of endosialidase n=1 Tax=Dysgonomonas macrotermitis TaxID=1346286 RepID=A0A1M4ZC57_9BACT|nr:hypothetical protein [Dysgonomonas macrotermitis]SHF15372.1 hypothetical protein SAMN05444362_10440 [Dysgonomonas macrotermitis]
MKNRRILLTALLSLVVVTLSAQDNYFTFNGTADVKMRCLARGAGGRAIVHDVNNTLVLNYAGDFTGGVKIGSNLTVQEKLTAKSLYLGPTSITDGWNRTDLEYRGHTLRIASPTGMSTHNQIEIYPGTNANALRYTSFQMFTSTTHTDFKNVVQIHTNGASYFNGGNVGIGTATPKNKLDVNGVIRATEVKVETGWADFVFADDYKLPTLKEVEAHISEHRHLPGIPSEAEVKAEGVSLGDMQAKLLQKIEELTLYVIEQNKVIDEQKEMLKEQNQRISILENTK